MGDPHAPEVLLVAHAPTTPGCGAFCIQSVLQAPVFTSAGVNRLAAALLNSSCPAGMGRVIQ